MTSCTIHSQCGHRLWCNIWCGSVRFSRPPACSCLQPAVCVCVCVGTASREAWSGHSTTRLEGTRAAEVPLSTGPIWPPHLSHPSTSLTLLSPCAPTSSECFLPTPVPAAASHITLEPGLKGWWSESRDSPIWTTGDGEERGSRGRTAAADRMGFRTKTVLNLWSLIFNLRLKKRSGG